MRLRRLRLLRQFAIRFPGLGNLLLLQLLFLLLFPLVEVPLVQALLLLQLLFLLFCPLIVFVA